MFNGYQPSFPMPYQMPQMQQQQPQGLQFVNGVESARMYQLAPNSQQILMDRNQARFYVVEADASGQQMSDCCCKTNRNIDSVNYNAARNTAAINENTTAQVQKVLDALCQGKIDALQAQVNQLQMQNALCGVVRYPNATTYNAGGNPFFGGNGCCGGYGTAFAA